MITYSKFGDNHHGNLGNQLFQYAAMIGMANEYGHQLQMPDWKYKQFFQDDYPLGNVIASTEAIYIKELHFHYDAPFWSVALATTQDQTIGIEGWLQSEMYWVNHKEKVKEALTFKHSFIQSVTDKLQQLSTINYQLSTCIAISIRRGDYVNNPNYYQLPISYYLHALYEHFPNWQQRTVIIFSDDIPYCKTHFAAATNVLYAEGLNDIEQLCLMSLCKDFIIANSTFSWWGAYLSQLRKLDFYNTPPLGCIGSVIRPAFHFAGKLLENNDAKDYYPSRWIEFNHEEKKFDLQDVTFTIPTAYDHPHRKQNLELNVCMLQRHFHTNIIVGEQGPNPQFKNMQQYCQYRYFFGMKEFHRTKMLNDMALMAHTDIIVNWDADVFLPPLNILMAVEALRHCEERHCEARSNLSNLSADVVYPYNGQFARVPRSYFKQMEQALDLGIFQNKQFPGMGAQDLQSVGGAVFFNKKAFVDGGMENENMISYGPEDRERYHRFHTLDFDIKKIPGPIYHLDHYRGPNSSSANTHFRKNHELHKQILAMDQQTLQEHIKTWPWLNSPSLRGTKQSAEGIDIVIPLGIGSTWKNNELRYCLRSIEKHLKGYRNIYIIGILPDFVLPTSNIIHISVPDDNPSNPARNIYYKLLQACYEQEISENFLMFNDDYFLTKDVQAATIPHYHKEHDLNQSVERVKAGNTFRTALENTAKALTAKALPIKNFDIHVPMLYNKKNFIEIMQQYNWAVPNGYTAKSLYCNSMKIEGELMFDCKINTNLTTAEIEQRIADRFVFSVGDAGLFGDMKAWLQQRFPNKSQFE